MHKVNSAATKFIAKDTPTGKAARELFKHGMRCLFQNEKASDIEAPSSENMKENITETSTTHNQHIAVVADTLATISTPDQCPPTSTSSNLIAGEIK